MAILQTRQIDWQALVEIEPQLQALEIRVRLGGGSHDYEIWKSTLKSLVGWDGQHREISSTIHYDVAHRHLLQVFEGSR
jgi:hypothetical protein